MSRSIKLVSIVAIALAVVIANRVETVQLGEAVAQAPGNYTIDITPASANVLSGSTIPYTVTLTCTGGAVGPLSGLTGSSVDFPNLTYSFSSDSIPCGGNVTLTVGNTNSVPAGLLSTPQQRIGRNITVTGTAN
jgi:hypothetical protein